MSRQIIATDNAPEAIGTYSQGVMVGKTGYLSGQIPLDPKTMVMAEDIEGQIHQVFKNLQALCQAAGGDLQSIVKLNIYVTDLGNFALLNDIMAQYFNQPYPARAAVEVSGLPKGSQVEMEAVIQLD